ncbi:hypothetical protein PGQ11_010511 [Apiospora arundinis]|uniref:Uncharacterized protein n=1 Tax=Apiospora arundinis TaxID=335852 RepID=A0ABR2IAF1_9PEZI
MLGAARLDFRGLEARDSQFHHISVVSSAVKKITLSGPKPPLRQLVVLFLGKVVLHAVLLKPALWIDSVPKGDTNEFKPSLVLLYRLTIAELAGFFFVQEAQSETIKDVRASQHRLDAQRFSVLGAEKQRAADRVAHVIADLVNGEDHSGNRDADVAQASKVLCLCVMKEVAKRLVAYHLRGEVVIVKSLVWYRSGLEMKTLSFAERNDGNNVEEDRQPRIREAECKGQCDVFVNLQSDNGARVEPTERQELGRLGCFKQSKLLQVLSGKGVAAHLGANFSIWSD